MFIAVLQEAGGSVFEVGGTVRDRLLNRPVKDKDYLVTGLPIERIIALLKPYGKITLVGKSFGVLKFSPHRERDVTYDIAVPRKEVSTGLGHRDFKVEYDHALPVEEDLGRRDFTINAMAWDIKKEKLIDPFRGKEDLEKKILKQVFENAFVEDPLRLLRAIQFATRFELAIEEKTLDSIKKNAHLIKTVSSERIAEELKKLLLASHPSRGFDLMHETGLLELIFPEISATRGIEQDKIHGSDVYRHTMIVLDAARGDPLIHNAGDLELMLAALFHDTGKAKTKRYSKKEGRTVFYGHQIVSKKIAEKRLKSLCAATMGVNINNILKLIENHMFETKAYYSERAIRRFINKIGVDLIFKLLDLRIADNRGGKYPGGVKGVLNLKKRVIAEINKKPPFGPKDLAVNGHDIMALGIKEGPGVGKIIKQLIELVLDDPKLNTKEQLLAIARQIIENGGVK